MRYFYLISFGIFVVIVFFILLKIVTPIRYVGPLSDHFNGKIFFNPTPYKMKTTSDLFRWWFSREKQKWPNHVKNLPYAGTTPILQAGKVKVTFVNHATILIQTQHLNILTDPIWSYRASPFTWYGPARVHDPGIPFEDLPNIDIVLISHNHYDHMDIPTLQRLENQFHPVFIVPLGNKKILEEAHIKRVIELDWWQPYQTGGAIITLLPTQHWSARWLNDKYASLWGAYGINIENKKIYFAGDAGYSTHFVDIKTKWGKPDIAFLPIGSYKPQWFMQGNHLSPEEAAVAHQDLEASQSIAIHYGTFQLSDEGINEPVEDLKKALLKLRIKLDAFIVLPEGQAKTF